jgi:hypothetical protein
MVGAIKGALAADAVHPLPGFAAGKRPLLWAVPMCPSSHCRCEDPSPYSCTVH